MPLAVGGVQEVAFKVLPGAIASDPERLARFKREAQVLASLSHPNVAHVYGFASYGSPRRLDGAFAGYGAGRGEDLSERESKSMGPG